MTGTGREPCPRAAWTGLPCAVASPGDGPCQACTAPLPSMCIAGHGPMIKVSDSMHECATCSFKASDVPPHPEQETDIAPDLVNPHEPGPECGDTHCYSHHVDESDVGAWRVCGECFHVYLTAEALREAWAEVDASYGLPGTDVIAPSADEIYACPYCLHDW